MKNKPVTAKIKISTIIITVALVGLDQLFKYLVELKVKPVGVVTVIPKVLQFHYFENDGAMMGLMQGRTILMSIAAVLCLALILFVIFSNKIKFGFVYCCIVLLAAGGLGNLIDRIFRGYVVDFIEATFVDFYIFNFADCLVTCAAFAIVIYEIYETIKESKKIKKELKENG